MKTPAQLRDEGRFGEAERLIDAALKDADAESAGPTVAGILADAYRNQREIADRLVDLKDRLVKDARENKAEADGYAGQLKQRERELATFVRRLHELEDGLREIRDLVGGESDDPDGDIARMTDIAIRTLRGGTVLPARSTADHMAWIIGQILGSLPKNKDWLDPTLERLARDAVS